MARLHILAIGRLRAGPERDLFDVYAGRLWPTPNLREFEAKTGKGTRRERECALLAAAIPAGAISVALDEQGEQLTSDKFAAHLGRWRDEGVGDIAFLLGGADGLTPALRDSTDKIVAFGRTTWPHLLARAMLAEQLYRAQQILSGHPYHRA